MLIRESIWATKQLDPPYWLQAWNDPIHFPIEASQLAVGCIVAMPRGLLNIIVKRSLCKQNGEKCLGLRVC